MNFRKTHYRLCIITAVCLFMLHPLFAQNKTEKLLRQTRKEIKTQILQRYGNKYPKQAINSMINQYIKIDSMRIIEMFKPTENIHEQLQKKLHKKPDNNTTSQMTTTAVNEQDSLALVALYNSTNGGAWTNKTKWLTGPVDTWYGITVVVDRVTRIDLGNNNLDGTIPTELGNLTNLTYIYLNFNNLSGSIPPELENLNELKTLSLYFNQLSGNIPPTLGNLTNLESLSLYNNQLSGNIPPTLGNLTNLESLSLGANQLSGAIPPALGNLTNLCYLNLYFNQLSGAIPPELGNLNNLEILDLYSNQLSGAIPPELGNLNNLRHLSLDYNQLSGTIPPALGNLANLNSLSLGANLLSGAIPPELGNLTNLQYLNLDNNQLSGTIPPVLGNLANLRSLNLQNNQLLGAIPAELGDLTHLMYLHLSLNQLSGSIPPELGNLTNLKILGLYSNQLSSSIPPELGNLTNLEMLILCINQFSGSIPPELGNLTKLSTFILDNNQLSGSIPADLGNMASLEQLTFYNNQLSGSIPPELGSLSSLIFLACGKNKLSGPIPPELGNLSSLQYLDLFSNQLSGAIPAELENLTNLRHFWVESNKLTGPLPLSLMKLTNLCNAGSDLRFNGLYTDDPALRDFLNLKCVYWGFTQTIAPENVSCRCMNTQAIRVSWTPIIYQADPGGYRVFYSTTSGGPYTEFGMTEDKTKNSLLITGLSPDQKYYFAVKTQTDPHTNNNNTVISEWSEEDSCFTRAPEIHAAPWKHDYGTVWTDSTEVFTFTVWNTGNLDLQVQKTLIYGPDGNDFTITSGGGSCTVPPGSETEITIEFHPSSAGKKTATLGIENNDPDDPIAYIALEGTGFVPDTTAPEIVHCFPPPHSLAIHRNSNIQFTLTDSSGTGVDSSSIAVEVNDSTIVADGADRTGGQVQLLSHSPSYTIVYDPLTDFTQDDVITVSVTAQDLADTHNTMDTTYTLTIGSATVTAVAADSVDQNGGTVISDTSDVSVIIPAGALDWKEKIQIGTIDDTPPLPDNVTGIGLSYHFGPTGLEFADSVTISIPYTQDMLDEAGVSNPGDLEIYYFLTSTGEWILLDVNGYDDTCIQVKVKQFCYLITGKTREATTIQDRERQMPQSCSLHQNHPNPFNPETSISYTLSKPAQVTLTVYNMIGQPVRTLVNTKMAAGTHEVIWHATNDAGQTVPSGIYFFILRNGSHTEIQKALLMK